jgi:uncharacterized cupin superfamily protein
MNDVQDLRATIDALASFPEKMERLFACFPQHLRRWAPPSWEGIPSERLNAVEQICHVRDVEIEGYQVRFERTLREDSPNLPDLPGEAMALERQYSIQDPMTALREFASARTKSVEEIRKFSTGELKRIAIFEGRLTSLAGLVHFLASHDYQHLSGLEWLLAKSEQVPGVARVPDAGRQQTVPTVLHIFTAPERGVPMVSSQSVMVREGKGIEGDRYFKASNRKGPDNELTLIEIEHIEAFNSTFGTHLSPDAPRRNIVTSGIRLNDLCGRQFQAGPLLLEGLELCEPCRLFKIRTDPRTLKFFEGKGGLRARVLSGGVLEVGALFKVPVVAVVAAEVPVRAKRSVYPEPFASRMEGRSKRQLGEVFSMSNFGVNLTTLAPGASSALRHAHTKQDEFVYILSGTATLHTDEGRVLLAPGMCAGFKAGTGNAHRLLNETTEDVQYLEIGDRTPGDEASYPDDDIKASLIEGKWAFTHRNGDPY